MARPRVFNPLSHQQFWALIDEIRSGRPEMSVLISTAYMDEAQRWDWIVAGRWTQAACWRPARPVS